MFACSCSARGSEDRRTRKATWSEDHSEGRWRCDDDDEISKRDKSLEDSDDLPDPDILAQEIAEDLQTVLDQFSAIARRLRE